ncbi:MAG: hypothetical protein ACOYOO_12780, partial [Saprospiraceae bacterium]
FKLKFGAKRHEKTFYTTPNYNSALRAKEYFGAAGGKRLFAQPNITFCRLLRQNVIITKTYAK